MLIEINIKNFKSIVDLTLPLSNINVFIGENGCGKTNILEAVGFLGTAFNQEINTANLGVKGIRSAKPSLMVNAFKKAKKNSAIKFTIKWQTSEKTFESKVAIKPHDPNDVYTAWEVDGAFAQQLTELLMNRVLTGEKLTAYAHLSDQAVKEALKDDVKKFFDTVGARFSVDANHPNSDSVELAWIYGTNTRLSEYVIYTPTASMLRGSHVESQVEPLGLFGEYLDVLISNFSKKEINELKEKSGFIGWLDDFAIDEKNDLKFNGYKVGRSNSLLYFKDKYMAKQNNFFSAENANEGVLHVLFYLALFISPKTPTLFGIDNIETALNPKLCRTLMKTLSQIAIQNDKQVLITTHNPAVLDGLNLHDDRQRLFVVKRNDEGHTQIERIKLKPNIEGEHLKLSEMWMRGHLGAIPNHF